MLKKPQIVWKGGAAQNPKPALPGSNRGLPTFVTYFTCKPQNFTEESYTARMVPGAMFAVTPGAWITSGIWDHTDSDRLTYVSMIRHNPIQTLSATHRKVLNSCVAIYIGQQRITEWDGKGWARIMRPMFIIDGQIIAALDAWSIVPVT